MGNDKTTTKQGLIVFVIIVLGIGFVLGNNYLQEKNDIVREKLEQEKIESDRQFDANQKESCLAIYKQESSKWNNVNGWRYDGVGDTCFIQYKASPQLSKSECDTQYKGADGEVMSFFLRDWLLCQDGLFENAF